MGERNNAGFYTVDSLRSGLIDQYAVMKNGRRHEVELGMHPSAPSRPFYLRYTVTHGAVVEEQRYQTFISVDEARSLYRSRVRNINH